MGNYVVGDVHGCLNTLKRLCDQCGICDGDTVYFIGDLVGKGSDEWGILEFIDTLPSYQLILGNHDLNFLRTHFRAHQEQSLTERQDKAYQRLQAGSLAKWHAKSDTLMVHAGIWPGWSLATTISLAAEVEAILKDTSLASQYYEVFFGDENQWHAQLIGWQRVRCIINILTRIRMLTSASKMDFDYTGPANPTSDTNHGDKDLTPWYQCRADWPCQQIVFGHWAMLKGQTGRKDIINIDGGCVYGGQLIGMCLETGERFTTANMD